jgi:DNA-3-methyladenine glycosylase I
VDAHEPLLVRYHDDEWGVPVHDDRVLFEFLVLEGAQAGLSWTTILKKRETYRKALHGFDPARIARYGAKDEARLLADAGIVRHRQKVASLGVNARAFLEIQREHGSFDAWLWAHVNGEPVVTRRASMRDIAARTELSDRISIELKRRGMKFVGTTIVYAFLQAVGVVDDHLNGCLRARADS